jgi:hypothetical protein
VDDSGGKSKARGFIGIAVAAIGFDSNSIQIPHR